MTYARAQLRGPGGGAPRFLLALALLFALAAPAVAQEEREPDLFRLAGSAIWVTQVSDIITTEALLQSGRGHETNPLWQGNHRYAAYPLKLAFAYGTNKLTAKMYRDGHRKAAWVTRIAIASAFAYVTTNNLSVAITLE